MKNGEMNKLRYKGVKKQTNEEMSEQRKRLVPQPKTNYHLRHGYCNYYVTVKI